MSDTPVRLSNWERWGKDDVLGTLNHMTPEGIKQAARLVTKGKAYSLSVPLDADSPRWPWRQQLWRVTQHQNDPQSWGGSEDVVIMNSHSGTHIDALCHEWYDSRMYNGYAVAEHVSSKGVTRNSIDNVPFIIGRGVLLDIAGWKGKAHLDLGEAVTADDLDKCAEAQNIKIKPGNILLVRTGWINVFTHNKELFVKGEPGIDKSTLPWLYDHDVIAVGSDNHAVEVIPQMPTNNMPVHHDGIRDMGLYLMEYFYLEELAQDKAYESLVVIAPLQFTGGAGSPINPIAIT